MIVELGAALSLGLALLCSQQVVVQELQSLEVGRVIVIGNEVTSTDDILKAMQVTPGQQVRHAELRRARTALARLGLGHVVGGKRVEPSVLPIPTETPSVYDLLILVQEKRRAAP